MLTRLAAASMEACWLPRWRGHTGSGSHTKESPLGILERHFSPPPSSPSIERMSERARRRFIIFIHSHQRRNRETDGRGRAIISTSGAHKQSARYLLGGLGDTILFLSFSPLAPPQPQYLRRCGQRPCARDAPLAARVCSSQRSLAIHLSSRLPCCSVNSSSSASSSSLS